MLANNYPPWDGLEHGSAGESRNDLFYLSHAILCSSALLYLGMEIVLSGNGQNQAVFSHFIESGTFSLWANPMDILQTC